MTMVANRRGFLMGLGMLGTAGLSEAMYPRRRVAPITDSQFEGLFPKQLGDWRYLTGNGLVLPPPDQMSKMLYEQLLTRIYVAGDQPIDQVGELDAVMLLLAYSSRQEGRLHLHRPDVCYPAAGFTTISNTPMSIDLGRGAVLPYRFMVAQRGERVENIAYWTRVGDDLPLDWSQQRLQMALYNLRGFVPDGLLGRVSIVSSDSQAALRRLDEFLRTMVNDVSAPARKLLIGDR